MKKGLKSYWVMLTLLLVLTLIFKDKIVYLAPNLTVSISLFIYSLTFLIPILILNKFKSATAKNAITSSFWYILIFYLGASLLCTISGNLDSAVVDSALKTIFTPNSFKLFGLIIYYPHLFVISFLVIYVLSHFILLAIYDAVKHYTNPYLGYGVALFIAFIIDTMFMVPMYHIKDIYFANIEMLDLIKYLTASFMVVIATSLILIATYPLFIKKKKN